MNLTKEKFTIGVLLLALCVMTYIVFQKTNAPVPENRISDSQKTIPPTKELKAAFEQSANHSAMADIAELSCLPTSSFNCSLDGCTPAAPATYYFVDYGTESGTYFRCDAKGCDQYPITVNPSGKFTQFMPSQGQAMLFKIATGNVLGTKGEFVDVATIGTGTIVSFGKCKTTK